MTGIKKHTRYDFHLVDSNGVARSWGYRKGKAAAHKRYAELCAFIERPSMTNYTVWVTKVEVTEKHTGVVREFDQYAAEDRCLDCGWPQDHGECRNWKCRNMKIRRDYEEVFNA